MKKILCFALFVLLLSAMEITKGFAQPTGSLNGVFTIAMYRQVCFSKGNLQYQASTDTWRFADHQWDYVGGINSEGYMYFDPYNGTVSGSTNNYVSPTYSGWIDLFGYGTSGWNSGVYAYQPWADTATLTNVEYLAEDLTGDYANADWGVYNAISNGGNQPGLWRTLSQEEWEFLINTRPGDRFARATVNGVCGVILLPDGWNSAYALNKINKPSASYDSNVISLSDWDNVLEANGAVFFPCGGVRGGHVISYVNSYGHYWTSTASQAFWFYYSSNGSPQNWTGTFSYLPCYGCSVRLVHDIEHSSSGGGTQNGHDYVDLGLPSGLMWATCNIGGDTPFDYGNYYAWGETQPKDIYSWSNYQYCNGDRSTINKYCVNSEYGYNGFTDGMTVLLSEDDAALANWGADWRMPTKAEFEELYNNTTNVWATQNGVNGRLFLASNGNCLFLPAGGVRSDGGVNDLGNYGDYWSSSLNTEYSNCGCSLNFRSGNNCGISDAYRCFGQLIRPVRSDNQSSAYSISATSNPIEGGTVSGGGSYNYGSTCTLTATPNTGYSFVRWTKNGSQVSTNPTYSFTVTENASYVAVFNSNGYTISASANPSAGGTVSGGGSYNYGSSCTLTATPATGYTFVKWTKNGSQVSTNPTYSFTVTENASYVAVFSLNSYTISVSANPSSGGTVSGGGTYNYGSSCTLTATPATGYTFVKWTKNGNQVSTNPTYGFGVTESASYVAVFSLNSYTISVSANPSAGGTVSGGGSYNYGSNCTLTATPATGYTFVKWMKNGSQVSTNPTYSFTVTGNASYVAVFSLNSYTISVSANPSAGGTVSGGGTYNYGSSCTLTATPATGYTFVKWTKNGSQVSTNPTYGFTVTESASYVAVFEEVIDYIVFADPNVRAICVANWDTDGDGELSYAEAAAVTSLGLVFNRNTTITSFEEFQYFTGLTNISSHAFYGCSGLTGNLTIPNTVTTIEANAFAYCTGFTGSLTIPNSVTSIGNRAFEGCSGFTDNLTLGNSVTTIGNYAFSRCTGLTGSLTIPNSVTTIGYGAFCGCTGFTGSLTLPNSVTTIGDQAFDGCSGFTGSLTIPNSVTAIGSSAFHSCSGFTGSLTIPNSVTSIGYGAFSDCNGFTGSLTIGNSVTTIGGNAFAYCNGLTGELIIPNSVTTIGGNAFADCTGFTGGLTIPNSVTSIGDRAFYRCSGFTNSLIIGSSVTTIDDEAFYGCTGFTGSLTIPNSVTSIGYKAFEGCSGFTSSLTVGNSVTTIGERAFKDCSGFTGVYFWGNIAQWCNIMFGDEYANPLTYAHNLYINNNLVTDLIIPETVTEIKDYAFIHCTGCIGDLTVPNSVTSIGREAFSDCSGCTGTLTIGNSVTTIGDRAFDNFGNFTTIIVMPETPPTLGLNVFSGVSNDILVYVPCVSLETYQNTEGWNAFTNYLGIDCPDNIITVTVNPAAGGTVFGAGEYNHGASCTLTATANSGYSFANWTENGEVVSTHTSYSFIVKRDRNLVANFVVFDGTCVLNGMFSVGENARVNFSPGNLQYQASTDTWRFAENQWDYVGGDNGNISASYSGWIDLFGWGTSGYNHGAVCYQPWSTNRNNSDYYAYGNDTYNLYDQTGQADWGYNAISNCGNQENSGWRTLSQPEWNYVFNTRTTPSGIRYAKANVNNVNGVILLPDDWDASHYSLGNVNEKNASFNSNIISASQWSALEQHGAVFLPAAGERYGTSARVVGSSGYYWSATCDSGFGAWFVDFYDENLHANYLYFFRYEGLSVRLVHPVENHYYDINVTPSPAEGGTVSGGGTYNYGSSCTLTATPATGYSFVCWTKNGSQVSTNTSYSFAVTENASYVAVFSLNSYTISASVNPSAGGTVSGGGTYNYGSSCTLTATANTGYTFTNWTKNGTVVSTNASYSFTVTVDGTYVANFSQNSYSISVSANPTAGGTVSGGGSYNYGSSCTLTATPATGYSFVRWTKNGSQVSTNPSYTFIVTENASYVAEFNEEIEEYIVFADPNVKAICIANWDTNGSGELSYAEAAAVTDLGEVFRGNTEITSFEELQYFTGLTSISYAFDGCSRLTGSLIIPNSVTEIGNYAFCYCSGFTGTLTIPNSVTTIGYWAFCGCSGLTGSLTIPNSVTWIGDNAFHGCSGFTGSLTIPNSVTEIGDWAFSNCTGLTGSLTIGNSVTTIGNGAFQNCTGFTGELIIPNTVTYLSGFRGCTGFTGTLTIPNSVTTIGYQAFDGCSGFTGSLTIPNSVTSIGFAAFASTSFTGTLIIPNSVTSIGYRAFQGCSGFTGSLTIPNSVTEIVDWAFSNCTGLTGSLTIGNSVTTIGNGAFQNCTGFTGELIIPNSVTYLSGFDGCTGFTGTLTIPNSVTTIGYQAFNGCTGFTGTLTIPNSVTEIGNWAFGNCSGLTLLTLPNSVTTISNLAFYNCTGLTSMNVLSETPPSLGSDVFYFVPKSIPVYVPCNSIEAYQNAEGWNEFTNYQCIIHEYVDLGLPSGTLWATYNVGAYSPEEYGDYFAWGETQPKDIYNWSTYQYCMGGNNTFTKYCGNSNYGYNGFTDNLTTLLPEDDAATVNWGEDWRMPTDEEWQELYNNTTVTWTQQNGVNGSLFTSSNGNSLFLPAAGYRHESSLLDAGSDGYYWSSLLFTYYPNDAWYLYFYSDPRDIYGVYGSRNYGQSVRPVRSAQNLTFGINATPNPAEGGEVSGGGAYEEGATCTLTATSNEGYEFVNWTENGEVVSTDATYSFTVTGERDLVANFSRNVFHFVTAGSWSNASNWSGGDLPEANNEVFIDASCQLDMDATVNALTVSDGQSFTLQSGKTLTVTNTLINTVTTGLIIEDGAQLVHSSENVSATVKKSILGHGTNRGKYALISNPLATTVNPELASIYHLTRGNYDLYDWLPNTPDNLEWRNYKDSDFIMLPDGYGYLYANQNGVELNFPGTLKPSDNRFGKSVSYDSSNTEHPGWNLIGNPFACNAKLVNANNEPLPYYRMNAAGNAFELVAPGTPIAPVEGIFYKASVNEIIYFIRADFSSDPHEYVDLGLPSGLLWATCNVGAESPEDYGDYFAWGETEPKDTYNWGTYQHCEGSDNTLTKYCSKFNNGYNGFTDNLITLLPEDDAATSNWGNGWRMPTNEELEELYNNTTVTWTIQNGVNGRLFTASNGNSLFLPAAGCRYYDILDNVGRHGYYWSSSLNTGSPYCTWFIYFDSVYYEMSNSGGRCSGLPVRAVREN